VKLVIDEALVNKIYVFKDRWDAGQKLGKKLKEIGVNADIVFAIPSGGIPVGYSVAKIIGAKLDVLICRKILIPWNREAGFGAVAPDGTYFVDEDFAEHLGLSSEEVEAALREQLNEIERRLSLFRANKPYEPLVGKRVVVVDDGIAAGYTTRAAVSFLKKLKPSKIVVAVPTAHTRSLQSLLNEVDQIVCLNPRGGLFYAVADAYETWYDLSENEVLDILEKAEKEGILAFSLK